VRLSLHARPLTTGTRWSSGGHTARPVRPHTSYSALCLICSQKIAHIETLGQKCSEEWTLCIRPKHKHELAQTVRYRPPVYPRVPSIPCIPPSATLLWARCSVASLQAYPALQMPSPIHAHSHASGCASIHWQQSPLALTRCCYPASGRRSRESRVDYGHTGYKQ